MKRRIDKLTKRINKPSESSFAVKKRKKWFVTRNSEAQIASFFPKSDFVRKYTDIKENMERKVRKILEASRDSDINDTNTGVIGGLSVSNGYSGSRLYCPDNKFLPNWA